ncbi:MAG: FAD-binding oxidoreductase [Pseudomonadota bacterium]
MSVDLLNLNDIDGQHAPSWYADSAPAFPPLPALAGDGRADICVVGAGYAGLSAALHLAERGYAVRVLEAHRVGWGASGRNGGQVAAGQRVDQVTLEALVGQSHARAAFQIGIDAADLVRALIDRHAIDCAYKPGLAELNHRRRFDREAQAYIAKLQRDYAYHSARYLTPAEVRDTIGSTAYSGGILDLASGHLHPLAYAQGLAGAALDAGATIHEASRVRALQSGSPNRVITEAGEILAEHVILACNGYIGELDAASAARVLPINSYIVATEPLPEYVAQACIPGDIAICDTRFVVRYFRLSEDRRMLFGGRESYGYRFPKDMSGSGRQRMLEIFPYLEPYAITHSWGGTLGITRSRLPNFLRVAPTMLSIGGFSGSGVAMATMAGAIAAETVAGQAERWDVMAALPRPPFPGGTRYRHALMMLGMIWYSLRDRL